MASKKNKPYRTDVTFESGTQREFDINDDLYWSNSTVEERFQTTTRLREFFHGEEATTGDIQRIYTVLKLK